MGTLILITGGSRSGKSNHALQLAEGVSASRAFVATCPVLDDEMAQRIRKHQEARQAGGWVTVEEEQDLAAAIRRVQVHDVVLVDCLTLWVNNLMYAAEQQGHVLAEDDVVAPAEGLIAACREHPGTVLLVTNEIGLGIIPDNPLVRRYRDMVGRLNQMVGRAADEVHLVVCGQVMEIKKG